MEWITSRQNPLFQRVRKLSGDPGFRRKQGRFVGEGPKLLAEAVKWGAEIEAVIAARGVRVPALPGIRVVETPPEVLASLSDVETPQGVLFLCALPDTALPNKGQIPSGGRYLVLDSVQDPGNVGTIWRTADAFGAMALFLAGNCADPFGPKTVRATMGACFRLPVWKGERSAVAGLLKAAGVPLCAAALREDAEDARRADLKHCAVVIGSEGRGISEEMLSLCDRSLKIPMMDRCESLNAAVAAAVVLWEGWR